MVLEWREHEHEDVDILAQQDFRACGLYKFWHRGSLREKPRLLQMLVDYWDPNSETFQLDEMPSALRLRISIPLQDYPAEGKW